MKVAFTGATGFVGRHMVRRFVNAGHDVVVLARPGSSTKLLPEQAVQIVEGELLRPETLPGVFEGCEVVVHLVGIIRETPDVTFSQAHVEAVRNVIECARKAGARRIIHMSAIGARADAASRYHQTKWDGEESVRGSGIEWVVLRPSIIFGKGDGFTAMLVDLIRKAPVIPVIGPGSNLLQPIAVEDVSSAFLASAENEEHAGHTYQLGGPDRLQYKQIVRMIARQMGSRKPQVHLPLALMRPLAAILSRLISKFPLTPDVITMLEEDNLADPNDAEAVFGLTLTAFQDGLKKILAA